MRAGDAVLGLGGCLDYEVAWDGSVLQQLADRHGLTLAELDRGEIITTERQLVASILAFLRDGVGGERRVATPDVIENVARLMERRVTLGGTSVRAGLVMSKVGVPSLLHLVSINDTMRDLLPSDVEWICSGEGDTLSPHLIIQYPAGARIALADGEIVSTAPNRLIYVSDQPNVDMVVDESLGDALADSRVFLISGFNAMVDEAALRDRVHTLRDAIARMPEGSTVVFEDAGFHVPAFADIFIDGLAGLIDVYGMNEDELAARAGRAVDLADPADVAAAVSAVRAQVHAATLVVHTSGWALACGDRAPRMRAALDSGVAFAATRYLHGDDLTAQLVDQTLALPRQQRGVAFAEALNAEFGDSCVCVPAFALDTAQPTTIGLGDTFVGGLLLGLLGAASAEETP